VRYLGTTGKKKYPLKRCSLPCFESVQQLDGRSNPSLADPGLGHRSNLIKI